MVRKQRSLCAGIKHLAGFACISARCTKRLAQAAQSDHSVPFLIPGSLYQFHYDLSSPGFKVQQRNCPNGSDADTSIGAASFESRVSDVWDTADVIVSR
jgi:hypothetical protein